MFCWFLINLAFSANLPPKKSTTTNFSNCGFILGANRSYTSFLSYSSILALCKRSHTCYNFSSWSHWTAGKWKSSIEYYSKLLEGILIKLRKTILSLSNLEYTNFDPKLFSQFYAMPPPLQCTFGGKRAYQKKQKSAPRTKNTGSKASREKRGRKPYQKKQKKNTPHCPSPSSNVILATTTVELDLRLEKASLQARQTSIKAIYAW